MRDGLPAAGACASGEDPRLERDAADLHAALSELIRVFQFRDRDRISCHDLSVTQCHALEVIVQHESLCLNDLSAHLFLDKSTTSRVVDALVRKGYVLRAVNPADRRALRLHATPEGTQLLGRIQRSILDDEKRLLGEFEPPLRREMANLIGLLARAAAARVDTTGGTCSSVG